MNSVKGWVENPCRKRGLKQHSVHKVWRVRQNTLWTCVIACRSPALEQISSCSPVTEGKDSGQGDLGKFVLLKNHLRQFRLLFHYLWPLAGYIISLLSILFQCKMKGLDKWFLRSLPTVWVRSQIVFDSVQRIKFWIWQTLIEHLLCAGPLLDTENTVLNKTSTFFGLWSLCHGI